MPILNATDLIGLNSTQQETLGKISDRILAAADVGAAAPVLTRTDFFGFDTEEEEALRKVLSYLYPTGYLTPNSALMGRELQDAFETNQVRDLVNAFNKLAVAMQAVD